MPIPNNTTQQAEKNIAGSTYGQKRGKVKNNVIRQPIENEILNKHFEIFIKTIDVNWCITVEITLRLKRFIILICICLTNFIIMNSILRV